MHLPAYRAHMQPVDSKLGRPTGTPRMCKKLKHRHHAHTPLFAHATHTNKPDSCTTCTMVITGSSAYTTWHCIAPRPMQPGPFGPGRSRSCVQPQLPVMLQCSMRWLPFADTALQKPAAGGWHQLGCPGCYLMASPETRSSGTSTSSMSSPAAPATASSHTKFSRSLVTW